MAKDNVRARVEELLAAQFERVGLTNDRVYDVLASIINGNINSDRDRGDRGQAR